MIRVVLDTNIVISALLSHDGPPSQIFRKAIAKRDVELCVSGAVYAEYEEVVRRPRLQRSRVVIESALFTIRENGHWVIPATSVRACSDPDDDIFLECALAADAQYLVSGNTRHFPSTSGNTRIVTARQFLDVTT